ncbi:MAG: hypothetical protein HGA85_08425 [Nanoarchaeota archaeon]|nr:hypothetical protein [Nanoarchaeota archaeon]
MVQTASAQDLLRILDEIIAETDRPVQHESIKRSPFQVEDHGQDNEKKHAIGELQTVNNEIELLNQVAEQLKEDCKNFSQKEKEFKDAIPQLKKNIRSVELHWKGIAHHHQEGARISEELVTLRNIIDKLDMKLGGEGLAKHLQEVVTISGGALQLLR